MLRRGSEWNAMAARRKSDGEAEAWTWGFVRAHIPGNFFAGPETGSGQNSTGAADRSGPAGSAARSGLGRDLPFFAARPLGRVSKTPRFPPCRKPRRSRGTERNTPSASRKLARAPNPAYLPSPLIAP
jgi:hypothetical protein